MDSKSELTPKEIVGELDRYVVGQADAKKAIAIALRNRWRRKQVSAPMCDEIIPHNILMVGPTGVGKTELARRMSKLMHAPFIKIEATKFTEIGYVGRDVDSIIRDLLDSAILLVRNRMRAEVQEQASTAAEAAIVTALTGENASDDTKKKFYTMFKKGQMDDKQVEIEVSENAPSNIPTFDIPGMGGGQVGVLNIGDILGKAIGYKKTKKVKMKVSEAFKQLLNEESDKLLDEENVTKQAVNLVENDGVVFIDEIDKIAARSQVKSEVNREGVQRDLLPLLEGTVINTKYGAIKTDHILFIASGAFHLVKPSDLLPELQGRLPIRVELYALDQKDMVRILKEPKYSLIKQYCALFAVENVEIEFTDDGIERIAEIAIDVNKEVENIGARRLHTIMENLLESLNFNASDTPGIRIKADKKYVNDHLNDLVKAQDLSQFIL